VKQQLPFTGNSFFVAGVFPFGPLRQKMPSGGSLPTPHTRGWAPAGVDGRLCLGFLQFKSGFFLLLLLFCFSFLPLSLLSVGSRHDPPLRIPPLLPQISHIPFLNRPSLSKYS